MKYKAVFLDVDGTTVIHGIDNVPSDRVTQAIRSCKEIGVSVNLATSRPPRAVKHILSHLDLDGYCVLSSGSQIYDASKKKIIIEKQITADALDAIISVASRHNADVKVYDGIHEVSYDADAPPVKVVGAYFPRLQTEDLQKISRELSGIEDISLHRMESWDDGYECLDIVSKDASKLHGIVEVAKLLGIETGEIIGVGDGYNDFPLLLACGLKIAMGNAVPELKAIADFVAPTVEEDGVATVIEKFILAR